MKTLMLAAHADAKSHRLNAPDSLMSTARSMRSDLSQDSIEEIKLNERRRVQSIKSGDLYRHTASRNKASERTGAYIDDKDSLMPGAQALTPYSNSRMYPQKRGMILLIKHIFGIRRIVGNEQILKTKAHAKKIYFVRPLGFRNLPLGKLVFTTS